MERKAMHYVGIDVGSTATKVAVLDGGELKCSGYLELADLHDCGSYWPCRPRRQPGRVGPVDGPSSHPGRG